MTTKERDFTKMKDLVRDGSSFVPVPATTRNRLLGLIREKTATKKRPSIAAIFRYTPAYTVALVLLVALPVVATLSLMILFPGGNAVPLVMISEKGGHVQGWDGALKAGDTFAEKDVIRTGPDEQVSIRRENSYVMHLFSSSVLEIVRYNPRKPDITVSLRIGALYVSESGSAAVSRSFRVLIDRYVCVLTGTRAYFSFSDTRVVRIICFDGGVEVSTLENNSTKILFELATGEQAEILPDGSWKIFGNNELTDEEKRLDKELFSDIPADRFFTELALHSKPIVSEIPVEERAPVSTPAEPKATLPPYTIEKVGNIAPKTDGDERVRFFATADAGGRIFILNREAVFILEGGKPVRVAGVVPDSSFRVNPTVAGKYLAVPTASRILFVDTALLSVYATLSLPKDGSIDHNFVPCFDNGTLYVPIQNNGYYTVDTMAARFALTPLSSEPFPVSPIKSMDRLFIGSYYSNYIGAVDKTGKTLFKKPITGGAFTNFVSEDKWIYLHAENDGVSEIVRLSITGDENGRWRIPGALTADFAVHDGRVTGITTDGNLFILDTLSGKTVSIGKLFAKEMTTREWRSIALLFSGSLIYAQTDAGTILVVDPERGLVVDTILVDPKEELYTASFIADGTLYCIANSGDVIKIVKNER